VLFVDICRLHRQTSAFVCSLSPFVGSSNEPGEAGGPQRRHSKPATNNSLPSAMIAKQVSYTLDSTLETVNSAEETASRFAAEAGFSEDEIMSIAMAVREATVNAVLHGNAYDPAKKVTLGLERTPSDLVVTVRDQGRGLDPNSIPDPLAPENLLKQSGRGIFLMRSLMDEVRISPSDTGTEIKLIKRVHGNSEARKEASQ
jgi:serine/threonine-protein kinase RsbW